MSNQAIFTAFTAACKAKLVEAQTKFGTTFDVNKVAISYGIKGRVAGRAKIDTNGVYHLQFNAEAVLNYNDDMTKDTIPHEVAHLVCFNQPQLGKDHDDGWKYVCYRLGGDNARCHDMTLTPAKIVESRRVDYKLPSGRICRVGPKHHKMIQAGCTTIFMRNPKEFVLAQYWVDYGKVPKAPQNILTAAGFNVVRADIPAVTQFSTKREKAQAIYVANKHLARGEVIKLFVAHAEMTPAGGATYYQNFKKAGI